MRACRPGSNEGAIEAELLHAFRSAGAVPAYEPIVGGGANGCVLHYRANSAPLRDGELLLVDAGAEYQCYAADITRTYPINGRWSPEQRALYEVVLEAQHAAIAEALPGRPFIAAHEAAVRAITRGLIRIGLLKGTLEANLRNESYKPFFMHKTGHWIGLDVHDVGDYRVDGAHRELEPGMVMTVEPGIYIAPGRQGRRGQMARHRHPHRGRRRRHQGRARGDYRGGDEGSGRDRGVDARLVARCKSEISSDGVGCGSADSGSVRPR
jgi:Xaa-Pro aminopeptidase